MTTEAIKYCEGCKYPLASGSGSGLCTVCDGPETRMPKVKDSVLEDWERRQEGQRRHGGARPSASTAKQIAKRRAARKAARKAKRRGRR